MKLKEKLQDTWLSSPDIPENWSALKPHLEAEIIRESIEKTYLDAETEVLHLSDGYKYFSSGPSWGIDPV